MKVVLESNRKTAAMSLFTAFTKIGGSAVMDAVRDKEKYPERIPNDFSFISKRSGQPLVRSKESDISWHI